MLLRSFPRRCNSTRLRVGMPVSLFGPPDQIMTTKDAFPPPAEPIASGRIRQQVSDNVFIVTFDEDNVGLSRLSIGDRVTRELHPGEQDPAVVAAADAAKSTKTCVFCSGSSPTSSGGSASASPHKDGEGTTGVPVIQAIVARVNGNGTYSVLDDDTNKFHAALPRVALKKVKSSATSSTSAGLEAIADWIRKRAHVRRYDAHSAASILYRRGWRVNDVYLIEHSDIHCMRQMPRSARVAILEAAERERDVQRVRREVNKELLAERDWPYFLSKYSRVWGMFVAAFGSYSAFLWNFKNYRKTQRPAQVAAAAQAWQVPEEPKRVKRVETEKRLARIFKELDPKHPRITITTGDMGVGKSVALKAVAAAYGSPTVFVELRGSLADDPILAVAKALNVANIPTCGDLFAFIEDVATRVRQDTGKMPAIVFKLRDYNVDRVFGDAMILGCDRRVANVFIEAGTEKAKRALLKYGRTEFVMITEFTPDEAREYVGNRVDPVALDEYIDVIGTNSSDLDELIAATTYRNIDAFDYVAIKLQRSIADLRIHPRITHQYLSELLRAPYESGTSFSETDVAAVPALDDLIFYKPNTKNYVFRTRAVMNAAAIVLSPDAQVAVAAELARIPEPDPVLHTHPLSPPAARSRYSGFWNSKLFRWGASNKHHAAAAEL
jgi:hypothetical protein